MSDGPYVRVYYTIRTDDRFESVYGDDAALAAWLRLLMTADAIWPAPADIPKWVKPGPFRKLVDAGLVEVAGDHYRIHGLDAERLGRSQKASIAAASRWSSAASNAPSTAGSNAAGNAQTMPSRDRAETEHSQAESESDPDAVDAYYYLTARMPRGRALDWCKRLGDEYGQQRASAAMSAAWSESDDISTLLSRTEDALARWRHDEERRERAAELARLAEKRRRRVVEAREVPSAATPEEVEAAIERYRQETSHDAA